MAAEHKFYTTVLELIDIDIDFDNKNSDIYKNLYHFNTFNSNECTYNDECNKFIIQYDSDYDYTLALVRHCVFPICFSHCYYEDVADCIKDAFGDYDKFKTNIDERLNNELTHLFECGVDKYSINVQVQFKFIIPKLSYYIDKYVCKALDNPFTIDPNFEFTLVKPCRD